jgi:hypothetical protein
MKYQTSLTNLNKVLLFCATFLLFLYPSTDSDLGWHLRYGDDIIKNHSVKLPNTYSTQLPGYIWTNHSWLSDVLSATIFNLTGFLGLSILAAALIAISVFIVHHRFFDASSPSLLVFYFFCQELLNNGFRPQLVSLLFTALIFVLLKDFYTRPAVWYLFPPLFILWANLHGQFLFGLIMLAIFAYYYKSNENLNRTRIIASTIASVLATLINPHGPKLLILALEHIRAPVQTYVFEWLPWEFTSPKFILLFIWFIISTSYMFFKKSQNNRKNSLFLILTGILALKARRFISLYLLLQTPTLAAWIKRKTAKHVIKRSLLNSLVLVIICLFGLSEVSKRQVLSQTWTSYCQGPVLCSESALNFLKTNNIAGRILNPDRLGGWLIYRYPETPVFMDGRMTLWQIGDRYLASDYLELIHGGPRSSQLLIEKQFDYIIIHNQFGLTKILSILNWPTIYSDTTLVIYQNPLL